MLDLLCTERHESIFEGGVMDSKRQVLSEPTDGDGCRFCVENSLYQDERTR